MVAGENCHAALEEFQTDYFPVLIADWMMPGMNGLTLCREIRKLARENYTYMVMLTSLEGKANHLEAMDAGVDDFMTKPFDLDQLKSRIHVAERIIGLQRRVAEGTRELREKNMQMEEELQMAQELQRALLPQKFPVIPLGASPTESTIKFSSFYCPKAVVSGDFFTVNRISDTEVAVFIADVMGHGVRAALITAMISALVEKFSEVAADPAEMLTRINRSLQAILQHSESTLFVTGFYLVADTARSRILYANAGHPEPFLLNRLRGELQSMSANGSGGPPLGLFDNARYGTCECPMSPDDFIMLFTDGLFEVQAPDEQIYSRERLETAVRNRVSLPSAKILAELMSEVREFSKHNEFSDDVCLLGLDIKRLSDAAVDPAAVQDRTDPCPVGLLPDS